jgi:hypothetical protein
LKTLKTGDMVEHKTHGIGTVLHQWGSWFSCRACYAEVNNIQGCKHITRVIKTKRAKYEDTRVRVQVTANPNCNSEGDPNLGIYLVSGSSIFDIQFPHGLECINQRWLKKI